jgi:hypothetical protein
VKVLIAAILLTFTCTCSNGQPCRQVRWGSAVLFTCPAPPAPPHGYLPLLLQPHSTSDIPHSTFHIPHSTFHIRLPHPSCC